MIHVSKYTNRPMDYMIWDREGGHQRWWRNARTYDISLGKKTVSKRFLTFFFQKPHICMYIYIHWKVSHIHIIHIYIWYYFVYLYTYMLHFARHLATSLTFNSRFSWFSKASQLVAVGRWNHLKLRRCLGWFRGAAARASQGFRGGIYIYILYLRDNWVYP